MTTITATEFDAWIEGLESDEHKQAHGQLRGSAIDASGEIGFCCLGLKCEIDGFDLETIIPVDALHVPYDERNATIPAAEAGGTSEDGYTAANLPPLAGLPQSLRSALAEANDDGKSFAQIAGFLRTFRDDILAGHEDWEYTCEEEDGCWGDEYKLVKA